jgi:tRNA pseudouridine38-40 synthase
VFLRYFVELSYNGKDYHGWQYQPNAISIQEVIENALTVLIGNKTAVVGCGRTDAGVHAIQYYLHFDIAHTVEESKLKFKLNAILPYSISVHQLFLVMEDDHARFDAISRTYEYRIYLGKNPFLIDTVLQVQNQEFDLEKMNSASEALYNFRNFKAFSKSKTDVKTFDCIVSQAGWIKQGNHLTFHITANRFLRNMVRAIVGTLLDIGTGKTTLDDFIKIIENKDRTCAGASVKAKGLFLTKVNYPESILKNCNVDRE